MTVKIWDNNEIEDEGGVAIMRGISNFIGL